MAPSAVMAATETNAAIKPYSIAVAPDSSWKSFWICSNLAYPVITHTHYM